MGSGWLLSTGMLGLVTLVEKNDLALFFEIFLFLLFLPFHFQFFLNFFLNFLNDGARL